MASLSFTTARLTAHSWQPTLDDPTARTRLEADLSTLLTPRVLEHLPPSMQLSPDAGGVTAWINARARESDVLQVTLTDTRDLVGLMILARDPGSTTPPQIHLGYLLAEPVWGKGLASELLAGLVDTIQGPVDLIGGVDAGNPASGRVLQKAGFRLAPDLSMPGTDMYTCRIG